ncbi:MAG: helix-turn-helix transcriptional regulator [Bacillota bacterium]
MKKEYTTFDDFLEKQTVLSKEELAEMDMKTEIIGKIIEARNGKGITQAEMAAICGWKQPAVARYEKMKAEPQLSSLIRMLRAVGLKLAVIPDDRLHKTA